MNSNYHLFVALPNAGALIGSLLKGASDVSESIALEGMSPTTIGKLYGSLATTAVLGMAAYGRGFAAVAGQVAMLGFFTLLDNCCCS